MFVSSISLLLIYPRRIAGPKQENSSASSFEWHDPMAQRRGSSQFLWFGMVVVVLITRSSMFPPTKRLTEVVHGIQRERKTAELKSFQTLDPAIITHKKVISYSLYGANPKSSYNTGMIANARLARNFFPTWTVRVYHGPTVPGTTLEELQSLGAELVDMANSTLQNKMFWRFIVAGKQQSSKPPSSSH